MTICDVQNEGMEGRDQICEREEDKPDKATNEEKERDEGSSCAADDNHLTEQTECDSPGKRHGEKMGRVHDVSEIDSDTHSKGDDAQGTTSEQVIDQLDIQQHAENSDSDVCVSEIEDQEERASDSTHPSTVQPDSGTNEALSNDRTISKTIEEGETEYPDEEDSTFVSSPTHLAESHTQESVDQVTSSVEQKIDVESHDEDVTKRDEVGKVELQDESSDADCWSCLSFLPTSGFRRGRTEPLVQAAEGDQGFSPLPEQALCPPGFEGFTMTSSTTSQRQPPLSDFSTLTTEDSENRRSVEPSSSTGDSLSQTEHHSSSNGSQTVHQVLKQPAVTSLT